jgi:hypothetical protein
MGIQDFMASKQSASTNKSANTSAAASPAKAVRASKPKTVKPSAVKAVTEPAAAAVPAPAKTPRVQSARHSKPAVTPVALEVPPAKEVPPAAVEVSVPPVAPPAISAHEAISKLAYGYWIARGYRDGNPQEDWLRAEREYLDRL